MITACWDGEHSGETARLVLEEPLVFEALDTVMVYRECFGLADLFDLQRYCCGFLDTVETVDTMPLLLVVVLNVFVLLEGGLLLSTTESCLKSNNDESAGDV